MRTPTRIRIKDVYSQSTASPNQAVVPGGGDGTFPGGSGSGGSTPNPGTTPTGQIIPVIYFRDTTSSGNTTWAWEFKSGATVLGTSSVQNPVFTFPSAGTYTVILTTNQGTVDHTVVVA